MNGYGHFLPRVRAFQAYWGAASRAAAGAGAAVLDAAARRARGASAWRRRRQRFERPDDRRRRARRCWRSSALGGFIFYNTNVLNRYETTDRPAGAAGRVREALQADGGRAAAEDQRGDAERRPLSARAAGADEGHATRSRTSPASRSAGCCWRSPRPPSSSSISSTSACRAGSRRTTSSSACGSTGSTPPLPPGAKIDARLRRRAADPRLHATKARTPPWSTTARSSTAGDVLPLIGYQDRGELERDLRPQEVRPRAQGADARPRRSGRRWQ